MKIAALLFLVGTASAARLEKIYLPPVSAGTSDAAGFVQAPGLFNGAYNARAGSGSYHNYGGRGGEPVAVTRYDNRNIGDGSYRFNYETANGISAEETGTARGNGQDVAGFYSYTGADGLKYTVRYTADENGFHAEGAHLPTPPPIPEEIRRGVESSLAAEARGDNLQGGSPRVHNEYQGAVGVGPGIGAGGYSY